MAAKRQITEAEKAQVLAWHGRKCFIDGAPFGDEDVVEYHHIKPFSEDGPTTPDNIAPVCRKHHLTIGTMSLQEYRDKLALEAFFQDGEPKTLDDLIRTKKGAFGQAIKFAVKDSNITLYPGDAPCTYPLHRCHATGWRYFYANVPVEFISNDAELQPRPLRLGSLWSLYRHFVANTQLAPSVCRMTDQGKLLLFDGQHKAAAQVWAGRNTVECKFYFDPDARRLKETNLTAHGSLRQMSFYTHELMSKYADIFGEDWAEYMATSGQKSEAGFSAFLAKAKKKTKAQANNEISLAIFSQIIEHPNNKLSAYLAEKHRGRKQPLTFARLKKAFFQNMLLPSPVADEFESETDMRGMERMNLVKFLNIVAEEGLDGRWSPERNDAAHRRAERIFSAGAVRAWAVLLRDAINQHLHHYTDEQRRRFFYCAIAEEEFDYFRGFVKKVFGHKLWDEPDPAGEIAARLAKDDAATSRSLFDEKGLTVQWLLGI